MSIFSTIGKVLMTPITGTIGAALGSVGLNSLGSYIGAKQQENFNAREAQKQRDWQEYMWNQSNAYNDPSAQMIRLQNAGLNANLVYGDGATTLAAQVGSGSHASAQQAKYNFDLISAYSNILQQNATIDNIKQDTDLKAQQQQFTAAQERKNNMEINKLNQDINESEARTDYYTSQRALTDANIIMQQFQNSIVSADGVYEVAVKKLKDEGIITGYQAETLRQQYEVLPQKIKYELDTMYETIENLKKQGKLIDAQAVQAYAAAVNLKAMASFYSASAELTKEQKNYYEILGKKEQVNIDKISQDIILAAMQGRMDIIKSFQSSFGTDMVSQFFKTLSYIMTHGTFTNEGNLDFHRDKLKETNILMNDILDKYK